MAMPPLSAPAPAPASAPAPSAAGDAASADGSGAGSSFGSVFDAATKSSDKTAGKSPAADTKDAIDDKSGKHSADADTSTATTAAAVAGLPMVPLAAAAPPTAPTRDVAAGDSAASRSTMANATRSSASVKTPATAVTTTAADPAAATDSAAASATTVAAATRAALPADATSKAVFLPQAANAPDTDGAHHAHDAKDLATALTTAISQSGLNPSLPSGAAPAAVGVHGAMQQPQPNVPIAIQHIAAPVGSAPWHDEVARGLLHVVTLHQQHAELHVNPPQMGPIDVHIHIAADQAAVTFTAAHADTRAALEQAMPRLRDMLSGQGIFLGQAAVQSDSRPRRGPSQDYRAPRRIAAAGTATAAAPPIRVVHYFSRSDRIVDTFA